MRTIISILLICIAIQLTAQKHDFVWLFGYESDTNTPGFGGTNIDFNTPTPNIYQEYRDMYFSETNASICDKNGSLLFYTNGIYIANRENQPMENGLGLNPGEYAFDHSEYGYLISQSVLILPHPSDENMYYLIHQDVQYPSDSLDWHSSILYYSKIDVSQNNGLGKVIEKNQTIIQDTLDLGKITATKHANGRDWWVLVNEYNSNRYYKLSLSPNGISIISSQAIGLEILKGIGQAIFSPNGSKFVYYTSNNREDGSFLNIYDFNRCNGELSNPIQINIIDEQFGNGVAISPSSKFLYVCSGIYLYQYDLWAEDIASSKDTVAIYDGFTDPFATTFYLAQLAPNGKIYITNVSSSSILHVIHEPNLQGEDCHVEQHGIDLPTYNNGSMPNFPNYRLGALEGSPCDTIVSNTNNIVVEKASVKVYPNPAQDYLDIEVTAAFDIDIPIEMIDIRGKIVFKSILPHQANSMKLSLENIPTGIYFLRIITTDGLLSNKIVISK